MPMNRGNDENIPADPEVYSEMVDLVVGDRIELIYKDSPETVIRATIRRILSDEDESMGPEIEEYVVSWFEIEMLDADDASAAQAASEADAWRRTVTLGTDFQYSLDGRRVAVRKS